MQRSSFAVPSFLACLLLVPSAMGQPGTPDQDESREAADGQGSEHRQEDETDEHEDAVRRTRRIGESATHTRMVLQRTRALLRPMQAAADIARELPRLTLDIEQAGKSDKLSQVSQLSPRELAEAQREWLTYATTFEEWQSTLSERATALENARNELEELREAWIALREGGEGWKLPKILLVRVKDSLKSIGEADTALDRELNSVLELEDRIAELAVVVEDVSEQIRVATAAYRERIFERDSPPLWFGLGRGERERARGDRARENPLLRSLESLVLLKKQPQTLYALLFVFVTVAGLLLRLGKRSSEWPLDDEALRLPRGIVARPFSVALLMASLVALYMIVNAPLIFSSLLVLLLLAPLVRVLPPLVSPHVRPILYFTIALIFVDRIERFMVTGHELRRLLLLLKSGLAAVAFFVWLLRHRKQKQRRTIAIRVVIGMAMVIATVGFLANLFGFMFLARMLMRGMIRSAYMGVALVAVVFVIRGVFELALRSGAARGLPSLRLHGELILKRMLLGVAFGAVLLWLKETLTGLNLWAPFTDWAQGLLDRKWQVGSASFSLGSILLFLLIFGASIAATRFVRFVLETDVLPPLRLEAGLDGVISMLSRYVTFGVGLLLALASLGIDTHQIAIIAGALGVGVGFGLQGIVSNFIAGLILMLERPIRIGDFIEIGPLTGSVERIGVRASRVRASDGAEVIVPNERLIGRELVNWTLSDRRRRVEVRVGVAYGNDPRRVLEVLNGVAETHADLLSGPPPTVYFLGFGESSLQFALRFWTGQFENWQRLQSEMGLRVNDALKSNGIELSPAPQVPVKAAPNP